MSCIIAHRLGWMVADRRVTFGSNYIGPYQRDKIRRGRASVLVGIAGRAVVGDLAAEALGKGSEHATLGSLVHVMRNAGAGSEALVLTTTELLGIDQHGAQTAITADYWAIGSGWQAALGWLAAVASERERMLVTPEDAQHAITFASRLNSDIGDGFQLERL